jgi:hypothetical protein
LGLLEIKDKNVELYITSVNRKHDTLMTYVPTASESDVVKSAPKLKKKAIEVSELYQLPNSGPLSSIPIEQTGEYLSKLQVKQHLDNYYIRNSLFIPDPRVIKVDAYISKCVLTKPEQPIIDTLERY